MMAAGSRARSVGRALAPWIAVLVLSAIGHLTVMPRGVPSDASSDAEFSAAGAMGHVEQIARAPHPVGSTQNERVRAYIIGELNELGVLVETQSTTVPGYYSEGQVQVVNIIGRIPGQPNAGSIALIAHYDTVPATPGGNDNSTAVAALLEAARVIVAQPAIRNDVLLLFTDGEEPAPRYGANLFAESPTMRDVQLAVNFEASGGAGAALLAETSGPQGWLIGELQASDAPAVAFSFLTDTARLIGEIGTDFDVFRTADVPGYHFAYVHDPSIYHMPADNVAAADAALLQNHGALAIAVVNHFGDTDLAGPLPTPGPRVFFTVGSTVVSYPEAWAVPMLLIAFLIAFPVLRPRTGEGIRVLWRRIRILPALAGLAIGVVAWVVAAAATSAMGAYEGYIYFGLILAATHYALSRSSPSSTDVGPLAVLIVFASLTAIVGRGFSYLFVWPLLAVGLALWVPDRYKLAQWFRFAMVATTTLILMVPAIDVLIQLAYPRPGNPDSSIPATILVPLALGLITTGLLSGFWPGRAAPEPLNEEARYGPSETHRPLEHTDAPL